MQLGTKVSPGLQLPLSSPYGSGCLSPAGNGLQPAFSAPSFVLCSVLAVSYVRAFRVVAIPQSALLAQVRSFWWSVGRSCPILTKLCSPRLPRVPALPPLPNGGCRRLCCFSAGGVTGGLVLRDNFGGHYGDAVEGFHPDALFDALGMEKDEQKLRYYLLMDELF